MPNKNKRKIDQIFQDELEPIILDKKRRIDYLNILETILQDFHLGTYKPNERYNDEDYKNLAIFLALYEYSADIGCDLLQELLEEENQEKIDENITAIKSNDEEFENKKKARLVPNKTTFLAKIRELSLQKIQELIYKSIKRAVKRFVTTVKPNTKILLAFDFTEEEYYGELNGEYINKGKTKNGTNLFFKFLTCNICMKGERFTLGMQIWKKGNSKEKYIKKMIKKVLDLDFKIEAVLIDRGFYDHKLFKMLDKMGLKIITPAKIYKPVKKHILNYYRRKGKRIVPYQIGSQNEYFNGHLIIYPKDKKISEIRREGRLHSLSENEIVKNFFVFFTNISVDRIDIWMRKYDKKIPKYYKKRWGIETSYRVQNEFKIPTNSKSPSIRYFYFGIKVVLYNCWVLLNIILITNQPTNKKHHYAPVKIFTWYIRMALPIKMKKILLLREWIKKPLSIISSEKEMVKNLT